MTLDYHWMINFAYALGIGVLIGLERSIDFRHQQKKNKKSRKKKKSAIIDVFGMRTFSVLSMIGFISVNLASVHPLLSMVFLSGGAALILFMYIKTDTEDNGITTEAAAILTMALGGTASIEPRIAGVSGVTLAVILSSKRFSNNVVDKIKRVELTDTLKFLVIIMIILPMLPNKALDPYGAFNPYKMTFLVILISGISFVGYFLTKFLGASKGLGLTGLLGGLTSSTAVTAAMSNQVKVTPSLFYSCAFATVIANATMFIRVLVIVAILDVSLALKLSWSIGAMSVAAMAITFLLWKISQKKTGKDSAKKDILIDNPFSLGPALKFAGFFILVLFAAKIAQIYWGDAGIYIASLVSGFADVDAITLSLSEQTKASLLSVKTAAIGITISVVSNGVVKSAIAFYSGGIRFGFLIGMALLGSTGIGLLVLLFIQ